MKQTTKGWLRFLPAVIIMSTIFMLSSRTNDELNTFLPWFQELFPQMTSFDWGHFIAYFVLALTFSYGFARRAERWSFKVLIVLLCVLYGVTDEYHQSFVSGRTPDLADIQHDGIGAALAVVIVALSFVNKLWRRLVALSE
ncbi:VanZ family protein [Paenibacillus sp. CF384]|uniref:VanZ family protein n=1 Tax=Paenibacillus sp. CF384 TaxID=1884382 RepID=UPI000899F63F|nr:VanZ family protein [Paenibacillus sp. CF384]SDW58489.1 VanZ like family protein [Paenibacillus sp. CF384]